MHIVIKKGLDIPIEGAPTTEQASSLQAETFAVDFRPYAHLPLRLHVVEGSHIAAGETLAEDASVAGRLFVSPTEATVLSIVRGEKRRLQEIVLQQIPTQPNKTPKNLSACKEDELLSLLLSSGLFTRIRSRPFNVLAHPKKPPRSIFVKALETAPFTPSIQMQLQGREASFVEGLRCLLRLSPGKIHVVTRQESPIHNLCQQLPIDIHTVEGPHPAANQSLHIQHIDPIVSPQDVIWTLNLLDTIAIGEYSLFGNLAVEQTICVAGTGLRPDHRRFVKTMAGVSAASLIGNGLIDHHTHLISGDPLTGTLIGPSDFLRNDTVLTVLPESSHDRELLHFLRLHPPGYTTTRTYIEPNKPLWSCTTDQHGEKRTFIDGSIYDRVMPFSIIPMFLVKALLANDFDKAIDYGVLEIIPEDFALADFICPSKIGMMQIVLEGQQQYYQQVML